MKNIYLICNNDGQVNSIAEGNNFKEVYDDTIGSNGGEFLVELTEKNIKLIIDTYNSLKEELVEV